MGVRVLEWSEASWNSDYSSDRTAITSKVRSRTSMAHSLTSHSLQVSELDDFARNTRYPSLALAANGKTSPPTPLRTIVLIHDLPTLIRGREHIPLPSLLASMGCPVVILVSSSDASRVLSLGNNCNGEFEVTELSFPPVTERRVLSTLKRIRGGHLLRKASFE